MVLTRLSLTDFRSYADVAVAPGPGFVVLTGENGAGKTNLLEAVSLLAPGRGLRGTALGDMARSDGSGSFAVAAELEGVTIGTGIAPSAPERRIVRINGATAAATALSEWLSIVWLTPAMDRLFTESAGNRRRFLDRLVLALDPAHARHSARYDAAMRQRNRLLADERPADPEWLSALEAQMAEHGAAIAHARNTLIDELFTAIAAEAETPFARAGLALEGWNEPAALPDQLAQGRSRDAAAGRTLNGPHRSDLAVTHVAKGQPAQRSSTGEQKALLLGIVLAHARLVSARAGRPPLLLLDEVAAHLDPVRRAALFDRLSQDGAQVWMTGTELALFSAITPSATRLHVAAGRIHPI